MKRMLPTPQERRFSHHLLFQRITFVTHKSRTYWPFVYHKTSSSKIFSILLSSFTSASLDSYHSLVSSIAFYTENLDTSRSLLITLSNTFCAVIFLELRVSDNWCTRFAFTTPLFDSLLWDSYFITKFESLFRNPHSQSSLLSSSPVLCCWTKINTCKCQRLLARTDAVNPHISQQHYHYHF